MSKYRVWPDGTTQCLGDGEEPYSWMSDDYCVVEAEDEASAVLAPLTPPHGLKS